MKKQLIRQLQKSGNGMSLRVPPKVCDALEVNKGDNLSFEFEPESKVVKLSKVVQPNPGLDVDQDKTHSESKAKADEVDKSKQSQQAEISKFEFCTSCGSDNIEVTGNTFYCVDCDIIYEVTPKGTKIIETNPSKNPDIEQRLDQLEQDVDGLKNNESGEDDYSDGFLQFAQVGVGTEDAEADEETEQDGFIMW